MSRYPQADHRPVHMLSSAFSQVRGRVGAQSCGQPLPTTCGGWENVGKDMTTRVGPGPHGVTAPIQGLADRKDTTDS